MGETEFGAAAFLSLSFCMFRLPRYIIEQLLLNCCSLLAAAHCSAAAAAGYCQTAVLLLFDYLQESPPAI